MHGRPRLRPWEIERLTVPELALALDQDIDSRRTPSGGAPKSHEEVLAYAAWWRGLTPRERIEQHRLKHGLAR